MKRGQFSSYLKISLANYRIFSLASSLPFFANNASHPPHLISIIVIIQSTTDSSENSCSTRGNKVLTSTRFEHVIETSTPPPPSPPSLYCTGCENVRRWRKSSLSWHVRMNHSPVDRAGLISRLSHEKVTKSATMACRGGHYTRVRIGCVAQSSLYSRLGYTRPQPMSRSDGTRTHRCVPRASVYTAVYTAWCANSVARNSLVQAWVETFQRIAGEYAVVGRNRIGG